MVKRLAAEGIFDRQRQQGEIKFYNDVKGFGFIGTESRDIYFHITHYIGPADPVKGERVTYEVVNRQARVQAVRVRPCPEVSTQDPGGGRPGGNPPSKPASREVSQPDDKGCQQMPHNQGGIYPGA